MKKTERSIFLLSAILSVLCLVFLSCAEMLNNASNTSVNTPSGLTVTSTGSTSVSLSWDSVSNADGYYVYYGTSSDSSSKCTSTSSTYCIVSGLSSSTTYYFWVSAYRGSTESSKSSYVYTYTKTKLGSPSGLVATVLSSSSVSLSWYSVSGASGYYIYYGTSSSASTYYGSSSTTSKTVTGLTSGTTYYFRVSAYDSSGLESDKSSYAYATPSGSGSYGNYSQVPSGASQISTGSSTYNYHYITSGNYQYYYFYGYSGVKYDIYWYDEYSGSNNYSYSSKADIYVGGCMAGQTVTDELDGAVDATNPGSGYITMPYSGYYVVRVRASTSGYYGIRVY